MTTDNDSQAHLAYLALERLIVTAALAPGARVTEGRLIELAGHGRTPVREAIQKLAWQGLIDIRSRVGLQVAPIRADDRRHVAAARRLLEPPVAELVAENGRHADVDRLVACAQAMTACSIRADMQGFLAADMDFDGILDDACPNRHLTAALEPLRPHGRRLWFMHADAQRMDRSVDLHVKVIRAIQQRDPAAARAAMATLIDDLAAEAP